jgi:hypothetical protein
MLTLSFVDHDTEPPIGCQFCCDAQQTSSPNVGTRAPNVFSNVSTVEIAEPSEPNYRGVSVQRCN